MPDKPTPSSQKFLRGIDKEQDPNNQSVDVDYSESETSRDIDDVRRPSIGDFDFGEGTSSTYPTLTVEKTVSDAPESNKEYKYSGRRIVDFGYIIDQIKSCVHEGGFGCSFISMRLVGEINYGLRSVFIFICEMCNLSIRIESEKVNPERYISINEAAVSATISVGIGYSQISEVCATMDIPCMSSTKFTEAQRDMSEKIHKIAGQQMAIAGKEERRLALESGSIDNDRIPMCTVVADGQWSKRSYKTNYDALSGVATIIGYKSKLILFIGIRNRYCCVCQRAKNKHVPIPEHACFLNWKKGATSMEADAIAEGDGDSSITRRLAEIMPYGPSLIIQKIECRNHLLRNYEVPLQNQLSTGIHYTIKQKLRNAWA
ncbi:uncharacterized protein LOC126839738 [Adelges cooleyi]|uniref:uncharacterized protein LOC126839738 n=1 Tax=Adelges cooleyi TaxID=133065 RepID=UPI00217FF9AC|nr:uncharacterized protein LOC126839738 [Adelges cooleyi]